MCKITKFWMRTNDPNRREDHRIACNIAMGKASTTSSTSAKATSTTKDKLGYNRGRRKKERV